MDNLRLQQLLNTAEQEISTLQKQLAEAHRERNAILGSRYWRAGEPMRRLSTRLRRWRGAFRPAAATTASSPPPAPALPVQRGERAVERDRPHLLIVSHEASATGAPILALNLAEGYQATHNVVVLLIAGGELSDRFRQASCAVLGPAQGPIDATALKRALAQVPGQGHPALALVNSIESRGVLPALFAAGIPSLALLHEFPAYTRPSHASTEVLLWADAVVFSCDLTRDDTLASGAPAGQPPVHVLPQGRCQSPSPPTPASAWDWPELKRWKAHHGGRTPTLILGAGAVQPRKGVDLFIAVAAAVSQRHDLLFVWIGSGYDPDSDLNCSAWLQDQIQRSGLQDQILMLPASGAYHSLLQSCEAFLLTSRLDPLPNVAIDALCAGKPVLAFEGASGIAELLGTDPALQRSCLCTYLDPRSMAEQLERLLANPEHRLSLSALCRALSEEQFDMEHYRAQLLGWGDEAARQNQRDANALQTIAAAAVIDAEFFCQAQISDPQLLAGLFLRQWQRNIGPRLPFAGFHPGLYAESQASSSDGLSSWLAAGQPPGPWSVPVIAPKPAPLPQRSTLQVGLHLHVFYPELLPELLHRLEHNQSRPHLILTLPDGVDQHRVEQVLLHAGIQQAELRRSPNRGRDLGPLLVDLGEELEDRFEVYGHLHTKRSELIDGGVARQWRQFLLGNLIGQATQPMLDPILERFSHDSNLGLVFAEDPNAVGWTKNRSIAEDLAVQMGLPTPLPEQLRFPVGTMFWARRGALSRLYQLHLNWDDLPDEPLGYDGTLLHAIERMLPFITQQANLGLATTHVPGLTR